MKIAGLQKLTLLDFPGRTAATVFLPGCNFRCPFCHNAELVVGAVGETVSETVGARSLDLTPLRASIDYLLTGVVPYEFRTTVIREFHTSHDLITLSQQIAGAHAWFLQSFVDADSVLAGPGTLHAFSPAELEALLPELRKSVPNTQLRGV